LPSGFDHVGINETPLYLKVPLTVRFLLTNKLPDIVKLFEISYANTLE
jgi:hypothetical protein